MVVSCCCCNITSASLCFWSLCCLSFGPIPVSSTPLNCVYSPLTSLFPTFSQFCIASLLSVFEGDGHHSGIHGESTLCYTTLPYHFLTFISTAEVHHPRLHLFSSVTDIDQRITACRHLRF
ncbi:uncharacterized protein BO95DRAFT_444373 [Aspergillus brunneoviolaceus CBS 621.78]|uniref:Uncharacterized protein n=1 Tax=Aspergillus brunneoviolaceus CBS 621.78 TaxID=1450534 RepID=A0ACD1G4W1_9EURO|nr:hypothetical protein BO95DRAFT_444373 [Aspergillus brunneoviolaceus CBS 621.78]RAH44274.1 hypothetical protein BO95DRAFT_444373 [Aspergillus brunneoviolaceus CBS 621.78]